MIIDYIEILLSLIHVFLLLWLLHRERIWHTDLKNNGSLIESDRKGNKIKTFNIPKEGMVRATRNAMLGPRGAVLRTLDEEDEEVEKNRQKKLFLAKAEKNPLTPLPDDLNPEDFR